LETAAAGTPWAQSLARVLLPTGALMDPAPSTGSGPDIGPFIAAHRTPAARLQQDGTDYFDFHHTPDDTLDKIDPAALNQNVAVWAAFAWMAAEGGLDFRAAPAPAAAR
jgi:hypothetical protein